MAIRRTKQDKQRANIRRQEGLGYTWKPVDDSPIVKQVKKVAVKPMETISDQYFSRDMRHSGLAVGIILLLLLLAWVVYR